MSPPAGKLEAVYKLKRENNFKMCSTTGYRRRSGQVCIPSGDGCLMKFQDLGVLDASHMSLKQLRDMLECNDWLRLWVMPFRFSV